MRLKVMCRARYSCRATAPPSKLTISVNRRRQGEIRCSLDLFAVRPRLNNRSWSFCNRCLHKAIPNSRKSRWLETVLMKIAKTEGTTVNKDSLLLLSAKLHVSIRSGKQTGSSVLREICESQYALRMRNFLAFSASLSVCPIDVRNSLNFLMPISRK